MKADTSVAVASVVRRRRMELIRRSSKLTVRTRLRIYLGTVNVFMYIYSYSASFLHFLYRHGIYYTWGCHRAPLLLDHSKFHFKTANVAFNLCEICIKASGFKVNNFRQSLSVLNVGLE